MNSKTNKTPEVRYHEARAEMQRSAEPGLHRQWMRAYAKMDAAREEIFARDGNYDTLTGQGRC